MRPRSTRPRLITPTFALVTTATLAYMLSVGVVLPTLPLFVKGPLGGTDVGVGLAVGAFSIAAVIVRPLVGRIGDHRGRAVLMMAGAAVVAVAMLGYTLAGSLTVLLALRVLQGFGEAAFFVGAATTITDLAPEDRRGEAVSYFSVAVYFSLTIGPTIGETVLGDDRFTAVWVTAAVLAAVGAVLAVRVPDTRTPPDVGEAAVPRRIVHRAGVLPGAVLALGIMGFAGFTAFVPLYARDLGLSGARMVFVVYGVTVLAIRLVGARLPDRLGPLRAGSLATGTIAAGLALTALWPAVPGLFAGTVLFAVGMALGFPALLPLAVNAAPQSESASVVGTFTAFFDVAQGIGAFALGAVAAAFGYRGAFAAGALAAAAGLVLLRAGYRTMETESPSPTGTTVDSNLGSEAILSLNARIPSTSASPAD